MVFADQAAEDLPALDSGSDFDDVAGLTRRGLGLARRSTATSCRSTSSSAFLDADERPSRTSKPQSRTKIR
jgi:hypothetical protein